MRTLQEKYNAINEGKFTKEQFLRDARMEQPNLVTRFNGYDDAVKILKNRGMISETKLTEDFSEFSNDALADMIINLSRYEGTEEDIERVEQELERRKEQVKEDQTQKHKIVAQWMGPDYYLAKKTESDWDEKDHELYDRLEKMVSTTGQAPDVGQFKHLKEATQLITTIKGLADYRYKVTNDMDKYPYEQILRGLRVELETMGVTATPTAEEYQKALAKVLKNLEKDSIYYTNQVAGVKANRKRTDLMIGATPKNEVDKENGLQKAQLKEAFKKIIKNILSEGDEFGEGEEAYEMQGPKTDAEYRRKLENYLNDNQMQQMKNKLYKILTDPNEETVGDKLWSFLEDYEKVEHYKNLMAIFRDYANKDYPESGELEEIGMFHDPVGHRKSEPEPQTYTKKLVKATDGVYVYNIFKNGELVKTIEGGEGDANAWINQANREGMYTEDIFESVSLKDLLD